MRDEKALFMGNVAGSGNGVLRVKDGAGKNLLDEEARNAQAARTVESFCGQTQKFLVPWPLPSTSTDGRCQLRDGRDRTGFKQESRRWTDTRNK